MPEDLPAKPKRIYDSAKFMGENVCAYYNDNMGIETVSLRFASTYGPGKTARHGPMAVMSRIVENPAHGLPFKLERGGDDKDDFIYNKDSALGIYLAVVADQLKSRVFNIGTGTGVTLWDFNLANARYLCPIGGNAEHNVLIFPLSGEPTTFIYSPVFTDYWKGAQSWVADVRPRKGSFADSIADRLTELKMTGAKIGIDGLAGPLDPDGWTPHTLYTRLKDRLPGVNLVNLEDMMEKLRMVKSAEEIAALDKAARLGDLMLARCRDTARPGVRECEVYAGMMEAMLANGGEEPTLFLWGSDKHPYPHPFRVPTMRPLEKGDMIICEMHPKFGGYYTHVERTFCLGKPEPRYLDIYEACLAAYRTGLDLFKPGAKISTAMDAVRDVITGSGFGICEAGIHGHGLASLE